MKRILLALGLIVMASQAHAVCSQIPLNVKDASSNTVAMSSATAADGNCKTYIDADTSSQLHSDLTAAIPAGSNLIGKVTINDGTNSATVNPCAIVTPTSVPVNISTATTTRIIAPSASNKTYICSMFLIAAGTQNVGIVEGTGGTCGTGTAGVIGGTTAATGPNLTAQAGFTLGNGLGAVAATAGTNVDFCLITSAAVQLSGVVTYVQKP